MSYLSQAAVLSFSTGVIMAIVSLAVWSVMGRITVETTVMSNSVEVVIICIMSLHNHICYMIINLPVISIGQTSNPFMGYNCKSLPWMRCPTH